MQFDVVAAIVWAVALGVFSLYKLKGFTFNTRKMTRIGLVAAITMVLYMIKIPFPQGGGCSLLSVVPIIILSYLFGIEEALVAAIVVGFLKIIAAPPMFIAQLPLDYFGGMMALAVGPVFGQTHKAQRIVGASIACLLSLSFSMFSGAILFGHFAPDGVTPWIHSITYNLSSYGVELLGSIILLTVLPWEQLKGVLTKEA